jgi:hypothetical protein|tara:strand:- start:272 stop:505 length:234 start_codon:yes stop_codon:yes gene_type:complete
MNDKERALNTQVEIRDGEGCVQRRKVMIPKEYIEYFEDYLADALNREVFDLAGSFTFPDGEEFPIVQLIIEASKGEK